MVLEYTVELRLFEPSIFRNSWFFEPKVVSLGFAALGQIFTFQIFWTNFCFARRLEKLVFHCSVMDTSCLFTALNESCSFSLNVTFLFMRSSGHCIFLFVKFYNSFPFNLQPSHHHPRKTLVRSAAVTSVPSPPPSQYPDEVTEVSEKYFLSSTYM